MTPAFRFRQPSFEVLPGGPLAAGDGYLASGDVLVQSVPTRAATDLKARSVFSMVDCV